MKYSIYGLLVAGLCVGACQPPNQTRPLEAIDKANDLLQRYGLLEMPTYGELAAYRQVMTQKEDGTELLPWTDSYWPTTQKGMARRWGPLLANEPFDSESDLKFGAFYRANQAASVSDGWINVNLSPAEKFDLTYQYQEKLQLKAAEPLIKRLEQIDLKVNALLANQELQDYERLAAKRGFAGEYFMALLGDYVDPTTLDDYYPMTTEGIRDWVSRARSGFYQFPGEYSDSAHSWSWEGLCHGWAPAAVMTKEPKHAVRVDLGQDAAGQGRQLLFTEGDIRGLLTKSWAESNNPELFFIGRRCEENVDDLSRDIPKNQFGRGIGGVFYHRIAGQDEEVPFTLVQEYPRATGHLSLMRIILEDQWKESQAKFAYLIENINTGKVYYVEDEVKAFAAVETLDVRGLESARRLRLYGCWDVNPASFHTVLVKNIGEENLGLVMDITRSGQVWNQPVYKAEFELGTLEPVASLSQPDTAKHYRAPGTQYVASVKAVVYWASEPYQPSFSYTDEVYGDRDRDQIQSSTFEYTLEFDAEQRLIGGEWGSLTSLDVPESPDFLFGYRKATEPNFARYGTEAYLSKGYQNIIKKIHQCSLQDQTTGKVTLSIPSRWGQDKQQTFAYVDCKI